jgi:hypothetical protein
MPDKSTNPVSPTQAIKPRRRWFQYSLRSLIVLMLLASIGMTWLVAIKKLADRQGASVKAFQKDGGTVFYDYEVDSSGAAIPSAQPPGPSWLRKLLGDDFFRTVIGVGVKTPRDMELVGDFGELRLVSAYHVPLRDTDLKSLRELHQLKTLVLDNTNVSDAVLENIKGLSLLEQLALGATGVTDARLEKLSGLTRLQGLDLYECKITDAGLICLLKFSRLQILTLHHTKITDAGLKQLKGLKSLTLLGIEGTHVSAGAVAEFKQELPSCEISYWRD